MAARILFVNSRQAQCSIWSSGQMVYQALKLSTRYPMDYVEVDRRHATLPAGYDVFVFNYHPITMRWLDARCFARLQGLKLTIVLEVLPNDPFPMCPRNLFDGYLALDPTMRCADPRVFAFPRPLDVLEPRHAHVAPPIPVIGTFGFATHGKGFEKVVDAVNQEFDEAIVRINIPHGTYVDRTAAYARELARACVARAKKGVEVRVTHDYRTKQQLVDWCAENTLNCFLYDRNMPGLSATTDQAVLSMRPLAVSRNDTFRHVTQYIRPYPEWSLRDSIARSAEGVARMKADWNPARFAERFEQVLATYPISDTPRSGKGAFALQRVGRVRQLRELVAGAGRERIRAKTACINRAFRQLGWFWLRCRRVVVRRHPSYSQAGEDLIVSALFRSFGLATFSYLDVGANHPDYISNTYLFYKQGCRGVCVEPNPALCKKHRRLRPEDVCLNVGVGIDARKTADFYLFGGIADGLSTFSKSDAEHWVDVGMAGFGKFRPAQVIPMPLMAINDILAAAATPDFLSLDVEGHDLSVLQTLDFARHAIKCICVETVKYGDDKRASRDPELMRFMKTCGYFIYADTGINTIYVNADWFQACQHRLEEAAEA